MSAWKQLKFNSFENPFGASLTTKPNDTIGYHNLYVYNRRENVLGFNQKIKKKNLFPFVWTFSYTRSLHLAHNIIWRVWNFWFKFLVTFSSTLFLLFSSFFEQTYIRSLVTVCIWLNRINYWKLFGDLYAENLYRF